MITHEEKFVHFIEAEMQTDPAHDLKHILRVVKTAKSLSIAEGAIPEIVIPAAWLHDCYSLPKNHANRDASSKIAADKAITFLAGINYANKYLDGIHHAIVAHSFSANVIPQTIEAKIVQDADRLDALGAIGIARCIQVSSSLNRELYSATDAFCSSREPDDQTYTVDHFYKKLLLIADSMNTDSAKVEAKKRTDFMLSFLNQLGHEI